MKRFMCMFMAIMLLSSVNVYAKGYSFKQEREVACVLFAEANTQSEKGKRLVVDVILNRIDSDEFPNTLEEVLTQKSQFSTSKEDPSYDLIQIVHEEMENRTNKDVLFFKTGDYHSFAVPIIKEGDHYFSGLDK